VLFDCSPVEEAGFLACKERLLWLTLSNALVINQQILEKPIAEPVY
jgi:hypothetical protein